MDKKMKGLGELELEILKRIWEHQPCSVQEMARVVGERRNCARTTVLTVMERLRAKGYLPRRKQKGAFRYSTTGDRQEVLSGLTEKFIDRVLDGSPLPFVASLIERKQLTPGQAAKLRELLGELEDRNGEGES